MAAPPPAASVCDLPLGTIDKNTPDKGYWVSSGCTPGCLPPHQFFSICTENAGVLLFDSTTEPQKYGATWEANLRVNPCASTPWRVWQLEQVPTPSLPGAWAAPSIESDCSSYPKTINAPLPSGRFYYKAVVPNMADIATRLGFEVVPWRKVSSDLAALDAERDLPSEVATRRGITEPRPREGVVLHPLHEFTTSNGNRVIVKHKGEAFSETKSPRPIVDPTALPVLTEAQAIADEWVTPRRLEHVLQRIESSGDISATPRVISAMVEDVSASSSCSSVVNFS